MRVMPVGQALVVEVWMVPGAYELFVDLGDTKVTDAGLVHLEGLTSLHNLFLIGTKVIDTGVERFKAALPVCDNIVH